MTDADNDEFGRPPDRPAERLHVLRGEAYLGIALHTTLAAIAAAAADAADGGLEVEDICKILEHVTAIVRGAAND